MSKVYETRKDLMERLQISESALYRLMREKKIPFFNIGVKGDGQGRGRGGVRFDPEAVDEALKKMMTENK